MVNILKTIKPLIIGIGVAGRRHLEAQLNLGIKTGIYTTNPQTAKSLKRQKNVIVFDKLEEGINWCNLVHVCTPDDKHAEFVALAIKNKKNVICEKSFTTNLKDTLYLQKLAHEYGTILLVGQNYRLTPSFAETKKRISAGQLGAIKKIKTTYLHDREDYQKRYPKQSFLYTGGAHAVDLACWVAGEQAKSVKAVSRDNLNFQIYLVFPSGLKAEIELDANSSRPVSGTDLIVEGEKGKLVSHNKSDKLYFFNNENKEEKIKLSNTTTFTIPVEIKIIDQYLTGNVTSFQPLPDVDEIINLMGILEKIKKLYSRS